MDPLVGLIMPWPCNFAPQGWLFCQGQTLQIAQYQALYSLLGSTYGATSSTFNLPNLQGAVAVGAGVAKTATNYVLGAIGGSEGITLNAAQMPAHIHAITPASNTATLNVSDAQANLLAPTAGSTIAAPGTNTGSRAPQFGTATLGFNTAAPNVALNAASIGFSGLPTTTAATGNNVAHENRQPFLVLNFIIAYQGIYPTRP